MRMRAVRVSGWTVGYTNVTLPVKSRPGYAASDTTAVWPARTSDRSCSNTLATIHNARQVRNLEESLPRHEAHAGAGRQLDHPRRPRVSAAAVNAGRPSPP